MPINSKGFTILETLLAAAVGMIILGGLMSALSVMSGFSHQAAMGASAMSFEQELANVIRQGPNCTAAITNPPLGPAQRFYPSTGTMTLTLHQMYLNGSTIPIDVTAGTQVQGTTPSSGVQVTALALIPIPTPSSMSTTPISTDIPNSSGGDPIKSWPATLHLQTMRMAGGTQQLNPAIDLPIRVIVDATTNVIQGCNMDTNEAELCVQMGGQWDPTQTGAARCSPKSTCEMAGSYTDQGAPGSYANPLTGRYNCPPSIPPFRPIRSGTISEAYRTSKYGIANRYYAVYTCVKCGTSFGAPPGGITTGGGIDYSGDATQLINTQNRVGAAAVVVSPTP